MVPHRVFETGQSSDIRIVAKRCIFEKPARPLVPWCGFRRFPCAARLPGLAMVIACLLLPSCDRRNPEWELGGRPEVRIGFSSGPLDLDPHANSEEVTNNLCFHIFDPLVFLDRNLKVVPWVASSWQNPDVTTWIFTIRPGIRFHDGTPLTSADVVYSIERIRALKLSPKKPFVLAVKSIRALDAERVEIVTREPYMPLLIKLSQIMILPSHYYEKHPLEYVKYHPMGSGPFKPVSVDCDRRILLEAVPDHWRGEKVFPRLRFDFVGDEQKRTDLLMSGGLDFIKEPASSRYAELEQGGRFRVVQTDGIRLLFMGLTFKEKLADGSPNPFRDTEVRQAISLALDRGRLCRETLSGMATPASQLVPPLVFGYTPGIPVPRIEPEKARRILAAKKFPFGKVFDIHYPADKYFRIRETVEACCRQLGSVGVQVRPLPVPTRVFIPTAADGKYDLLITGWSAITGDTSDFFENCFHSRVEGSSYGFFNPVDYSKPDMDEMIEASAHLARRDTRLAMLQKIMGECMNELIWIPLYFLEDSYAYRSDLEFRPRVDRYVMASDLEPRQ
jgi:peptide/nickel transport system substrate-binding protein